MDNDKAKQNASLIADVHDIRSEIQGTIDRVSGAYNNRESALVVTKLQEAKMWAGQLLGVLGSELPDQYKDPAKKGK